MSRVTEASRAFGRRRRLWGLFVTVGLTFGAMVIACGSDILLGSLPVDDGAARDGGGLGSESSVSSNSVADGSVLVDGAGDSGDAGALSTAISARTIATNALVFATGFSSQNHVIFAEGDQRYWVFYVDATQRAIKTRVSKDFVTWAEGTSLPLKGAANTVTDGNNFSVAYAWLGGVDVVHVIANTIAPEPAETETIHLRTTISGGALTAPVTVVLPATSTTGPTGTSGFNCPEDGPVTLVTSTGRVLDVTAWTGHSGVTTCDSNVYRSTTVDTGASFGTAFDRDRYLITVPGYTFAHQLVELPTKGVLLGWPDQDEQGPNNDLRIFSAVDWWLSPFVGGDGSGTFPDASAHVFESAGGQSGFDDWAMCRLTDSDVHMVRHVFSAAVTTNVSDFQEVRFDGTRWSSATPPGPVAGTSNTGVVLLSDADPSHGMLAIAIGTDNALHIAKWTTAGGWRVLPSFPGSTKRQSLSGSGCGGAHPQVFWTEGSSAPFTLLGADLSALLLLPI